MRGTAASDGTDRVSNAVQDVASVSHLAILGELCRNGACHAGRDALRNCRIPEMSKTALFHRVPACGRPCRSCDGVFDMEFGTHSERRGMRLCPSRPPYGTMILSVQPMGTNDTQKSLIHTRGPFFTLATSHDLLTACIHPSKHLAITRSEVYPGTCCKQLEAS